MIYKRECPRLLPSNFKLPEFSRADSGADHLGRASRKHAQTHSNNFFQARFGHSGIISMVATLGEPH
jgi:hypothetical protein